MIAYIRGKLVSRTPTYVIIETNGGVAYHIHISLNTYTKITNPENTQLFTYFHVKEDIQALYGFAEDVERQLFIQLISVSGIGPATAQVMLSSINPQEMQEAILSENIALLKSVKGIGPKTAKRMVLELKDKIQKTVGTETLPTMGKDQTAALKEEALTALVTLGIGKPLAKKAIDKVYRGGLKPSSVEILIKEALNRL